MEKKNLICDLFFSEWKTRPEKIIDSSHSCSTGVLDLKKRPGTSVKKNVWTLSWNHFTICHQCYEERKPINYQPGLLFSSLHLHQVDQFINWFAKFSIHSSFFYTLFILLNFYLACDCSRTNRQGFVCSICHFLSCFTRTWSNFPLCNTRPALCLM